jgi:hypothetical protein
MSDEAKEVLERAAAARAQMEAKLARAREFYARCGVSGISACETDLAA